MKKPYSSFQDPQAWLAVLENQSNHKTALACFHARGLATQDQIELLTDLSTKQARSALEDLSRQQTSKQPALLRTAAAKLQGAMGRSRQVYLLTVEGADISRALYPDCFVQPPALQDPVELAHALAEMDVYARAFKAGLKCSLEHVLTFGPTGNPASRSSVRADVLVLPDNQPPYLIEIEQCARRRDIPRIADKLRHLADFYHSNPTHQPGADIRILFNLPSDDKQTIPVWQCVLGELQQAIGELPFRLHWQPAVRFLNTPEWDGLNSFEALRPEPPDYPLQPELPSGLVESNEPRGEVRSEIQLIPSIPNDLLPAFITERPLELQEQAVIFRVLGNTLRDMENSEPLRVRNRAYFFELMRMIYEASHYKDGPVRREAAFPYTSLLLLHRYLHMHQNAPLLDTVLQTRRDVARNLNRGINLFRDAFTRMCWAFLRRHGFGPNGPLRVTVEVPGFDSHRSDVYVDARISGTELLFDENELYMDNDRQRTQAALSWVLEALWTYGEDLELIQKSRKA